MNATERGVAGALAAGAGYVLYHLVKQQGRLLLRIEHLEGMLGVNGQHNHGLVASAGDGVATPVGLPIGAPVDPFTLADLDGNDVSLESYKGRQVVLVNWSPTCGFCEMIGGELATAAADLDRANTSLLLLAHGDAAANRALAERHGITSPVLLLGDADPVGFQSLGTPSALLVDADGKVATSLAVGADQVPVLIRDVADAGAGDSPSSKLRGQRNLSESRLVRDGLKAGTPAPPFELPDLDGNTVSLEDYRGRRVLLTFSTPDCGPCDALAPHLVKVHEEHEGNNLAVVMVGRGDLEQNRRKATQHGFKFPVVLQEGWNLSRQYGIFATPVAFLIDETGTITRDVATGVDEIVALVPIQQGGR